MKRVKISVNVLVSIILICMYTPLSVFADNDIASGIYRDVSWRITAKGELIIGKEGETQSFDNSNQTDFPWLNKASEITSLSFAGTVLGNAEMDNMFNGCHYLVSADLSGFDTSNVTDMSHMFDECEALTSLDLSSFDTSSVTDMSYMFDCPNLTSLDISSFDTSNVTNMSNMFCLFNITSLDVSGFDTSNVTNMSYMFWLRNNLTSLDVSGFDTSNVTDMSGMFYGCHALTSLNVSGFDTSNVTDMIGMFNYCQSLTSLDVSGFDTSNVTNMDAMFAGCHALTSLDVSGFDTSNVTDMHALFSGCKNISLLDLSSFDTSNVTDMSYMFYNCNSLVTLKTPQNSTRMPSLPYSMYDKDGNEYTHLPQLKYSITLYKNKDEIQEAVSVDSLTIDGVEDKVYTGNSITQKIVVKDKQVILRENTDYVVEFVRKVPHFPPIKIRSCETVTAENEVLSHCTESTGEDMENEPVREP